jgi:putative glutamine amidotransferase
VPKPLIGITAVRVTRSAHPRDQLKAAYAEAVQAAGGVPVIVPNGAGPEVLAYVDGLLLTGGGDVDPAWFGEADDGTDWSGVERLRDKTEIGLVRAADPDLPVLGICRGMQVLAVALGGRLVQDLGRGWPGAGVHRPVEAEGDVRHPVRLDPGSRLAGMLGGTTLMVNSAHHQAVRTCPPGFLPVAWAPDEVVEAMEEPGRRFRIGVQWHPEDLYREWEHAARLFGAFVEAAARRRTARG